MTPAQKSDYIEQKKHESQARRDERHDRILAARTFCKSKDRIWVIKGHFSRTEVSRMKRETNWFPKSAYLADFGCMTSSDFRDELRRAGYIF